MSVTNAAIFSLRPKIFKVSGYHREMNGVFTGSRLHVAQVLLSYTLSQIVINRIRIPSSHKQPIRRQAVDPCLVLLSFNQLVL